MKPLILSIVVILCAAICKGQNKLIAEKKFAEQLNSILKGTTSFHWAFEDRFTVDTPFHIKNGILAVTLRFSNDSSYYKVRVTVPVKSIRNVGHDLYLILECAKNSVTFYQSPPNTDLLMETSSSNLFHVGLFEDEAGNTLTQLRQYLRALLVHYPSGR